MHAKNIQSPMFNDGQIHIAKWVRNAIGVLLLPLQEFIEQVFFVAPDNELTHQIAPDIVPDVSKIRLDTIAVPVLLISPRTRKKNRLTSAEMCV